MAGLVGPGGRLGLRAGRGRVGVVWWAGWGSVAGRVGGGPVGWADGPVAVNVYTARKGVCNCRVKNGLLAW